MNPYTKDAIKFWLLVPIGFVASLFLFSLISGMMIASRLVYGAHEAAMSASGSMHEAERRV